MITDKISEYLINRGKYTEDDDGLLAEASLIAQEAFRKLAWVKDEEEKPNKLYMSSTGYCPRKNAYKYHGLPENGREMTPRTYMNFFMGDVVELAVMLLAVKAGCDIKDYGVQQKRVVRKVQDKEVSGRRDGVLDVGGKKYPIEVKSMSTYAFRAFKDKGDISHHYVTQCHEYMMEMGVDACVLVGVCKDTGHFAEKVVLRNPIIELEVKANALAVVTSSPDDLPPIPEDKKANAKGLYNWECDFCSYALTCHPEAKFGIIRGTTKLVKQNKKEEVKNESQVSKV